MNYSDLPKRVFNSPLIAYANFADGSHVNLIRLVKPYANGWCYAIVNTTFSRASHPSGMFKTFKKAKDQFDLIIKAVPEWNCKLIKKEWIPENMTDGKLEAMAPAMLDTLRSLNTYFVNLQNKVALAPADENAWKKVSKIVVQFKDYPNE